MKITKVEVSKVNKEDSKLKGYAKIIIDEALEINNIRIIEGKSRMFCAMPSHARKDGRFEDYVQPKNQETRDLIEKVILDKYNEE